jgi:hypothetical protein
MNPSLDSRHVVCAPRPARSEAPFVSTTQVSEVICFNGFIVLSTVSKIGQGLLCVGDARPVYVGELGKVLEHTQIDEGREVIEDGRVSLAWTLTRTCVPLLDTCGGDESPIS